MLLRFVVMASGTLVLAACITTGDKERAAPTPTATAAPSGEVPRTATALNAWLQQRPYGSWRQESFAHESEGPHGLSVRTYLNASLDASLSAGAAEHPAGASAVKEVLTNGQLSGWLVMVKTADKSESGRGWYWYEVLSATPNAQANSGNGIASCGDCHQRGRDFIQSRHPLR